MIASLAKADIARGEFALHRSSIAEPFAKGKTRVMLPGVHPPAGAAREFAPRAAVEKSEAAHHRASRTAQRHRHGTARLAGIARGLSGLDL